MKKRIISLLLAIAMVLPLCSAFELPAIAASNIVIAGVDIGYAVGDYFTKDGKSCATSAFSNGTCHGHSICISNTDSRCNCMRYWPTNVKATCQVDLMATQCFGFARFCQWKVYGYHDGQQNSKFENLTGTISASNCTGENIKSKLLGCAPATHIRTGDDGHSIVVLSTSSSGIKTIACNTKVDGVKVCKIYSNSYTWDGFASYLKGRSGVLYAKAHKGSSSVVPPDTSYGSTNPDEYDYPERSLIYSSGSATMTGDDVAWVQAVLYQLGYSITVDGKYGPGTRDIVKKFQGDYGLTVDGKCGPATRAKLKELWEAKKHVHSYSNDCDASCNTCGATRTPAAHKYDNACDKYCNVCGLSRTPSSHVYTNDCDEYCNVCFALRSVPGHSYDNACDAICNRCGATRTPAAHVYTTVGYDKTHPHNEYKRCSCGEIQYTGAEQNAWDETLYHDEAHPHSIYKLCIPCGWKEYTGQCETVSSCASCYPVGTATISLSSAKVAAGEKVTVSWPAVTNAKEYNVRYYDSNHQYYTIQKTTALSLEISFDKPGTYVIYVDSIGINGDVKQSNEPSLTVYRAYVISYDLNGGTGDAPTSVSESNTIPLITAIPQKSGYQFDGWIFEPNDASMLTIGGKAYVIAGNSTEYRAIAQWSCIAHNYDNACDGDCNVCGTTRTPSAHVYDNACDGNCNVCGATRTPAAHVYSNACDASCNVCGAARTSTAHKYDNACDKDCNVCGLSRTPSSHVYSNACDGDCNVCGTTRTPSAHVYDNACDGNCNVCGATRTPAAHKYDNACDGNCNVCGATRTPAAHKYDNACDKYCNVCGLSRTPSSHVYTNACDASCNVCGTTRTPSAHQYDNEKDTDCNECGFVRELLFTPGDLDGVDGVSSSDAIYLLYHTLFGEERYPVNQPVDYDGDGATSSSDAIYLLYYTLFGGERYPI